MNTLRKGARLAATWTLALALVLIVFAVNFVLFIGRPSWPFGL